MEPTMAVLRKQLYIGSEIETSRLQPSLLAQVLEGEPLASSSLRGGSWTSNSHLTSDLCAIPIGFGHCCCQPTKASGPSAWPFAWPQEPVQSTSGCLLAHIVDLPSCSSWFLTSPSSRGS